MFSSDHAPYRFDESGKLHSGPNPSFKEIANGVPGLEIRMAMLFHYGVGAGRIDLNRFVALTATNAAKIYGLHPTKGTIAIGSDADIAIWDPTREVTLSAEMLHDNVGYTPYEGHRITGWPETVLSRGRIVVADGALKAKRGSGRFPSPQTVRGGQTARPPGAGHGSGEKFRSGPSELGGQIVLLLA